MDDGTPCNGGECWGGSCLPLLDGGLPPDGPPQQDAAANDGAPCCEDAGGAEGGGADAAHERRGWVGWGCTLGGGPATPWGMLALLLTNLGRVILRRRGRRPHNKV